MEGECARGICWGCGRRLLPHPWAGPSSTVRPHPGPESPGTPGPASVRLSARPPSIPALGSSSSGGNQSPTTPDQGPWEKGSSPILTGARPTCLVLAAAGAVCRGPGFCSGGWGSTWPACGWLRVPQPWPGCLNHACPPPHPTPGPGHNRNPASLLCDLRAQRTPLNNPPLGPCGETGPHKGTGSTSQLAAYWPGSGTRGVLVAWTDPVCGGRAGE